MKKTTIVRVLKIFTLQTFAGGLIEVEKGKRIYAKDTSKDPLFVIVRELFPSTGGLLSTNVGMNYPVLILEI